MRSKLSSFTALVATLALGLTAIGMLAAADETSGIPERFQRDSSGCTSCHAGIEEMHPTGVAISCVGCHGGNGKAKDIDEAHVAPSRKGQRLGRGLTSGNGIDLYGDLMNEPAEYVRFVNPGDLRIAGDTCGHCHADIYSRVRSSIMATSANVPAAVLYDNGASPSQTALHGEAFLADGTPARLEARAPLTEEQKKNGALPFLAPLPRWEATAAPDVFRVFDRGNNAAGTRDRGTEFKIAGVYLNLVKTRLNDPALWLPGTNAGAGDYRQSGCSACHILYANDGNPAHAGPSAGHGNVGRSDSNERAVPRGASGHPLKHQLTRSVPISQCLTCHHHQGNGALTTYAGYFWHDQETEAKTLIALDAMPGGSGQPALAAANDQFRQQRFADFHGHKWNFRAVYWQDRRGNLLDAEGKVVPFADADRFQRAVHLKDIHLEKGMHCIDCHTESDVHGDGFLYGAMIDAVEIGCIDCHGTQTERSTLETSGAAAGPHSIKNVRTPFGGKQFQKKGGKLLQRSKVTEGLEWEVPQLVDVLDPASPSFNARAARAMGMKREDGSLTHDPSKMECYSCHSSWNTNCYGCHLPFDANTRAKDNHTGLGDSRGYAQYNPQVLRTDAYTLGINGDVQGNRWSPIRSASAVVVSVKDRNRNVPVNQQPTISSSGLSGQAITPNMPHTVRGGRQTKGCSDCHVSENGDNNAVMATLLGLGTNAANWVGDYVFVAEGSGLAAIRVTEGYEPRPVIGSDFHTDLHPESAARFAKKGRKLREAHVAGASNASSVAILGEFALVADGPRGLVVYDVANVANKGVADRIVEKPTTILGQSLWARSEDARWVAMAASVPMDPSRETGPDRKQPKVAPIMTHAFVADAKEGLVVVDVSTLVDGIPTGNRLPVVARFNPAGKLSGAVHAVLHGNHVLLSCGDKGLAIVDVTDPAKPMLAAQVPLKGARQAAVQFRYAFVADKEGISVVDVTDPARPALTSGKLAIPDARGLAISRTWLLVAAGKQGLLVVDVTKPTSPALTVTYDAGGALDDAEGLTIATTNASTFAYVADGKNGLRIVSLVEPARVPGHFGFAPVPVPKLLATWKGKGPARAVADGLKRDRYADEAGNAISVGSRIGSRPLGSAEMRRLFLKNGSVWTVRDEEPVAVLPAVTPEVSPTPAQATAATPTPLPSPTPEAP